MPKNVSEVTDNTTDFRELVLRIVDNVLKFLGLLAVIMVIYGGITYVTAAGDDEKVGKAKNIILYSVIGIVIVLLSFALINTVVGLGAGSASTT